MSWKTKYLLTLISMIFNALVLGIYICIYGTIPGIVIIPFAFFMMSASFYAYCIRIENT